MFRLLILGFEDVFISKLYVLRIFGFYFQIEDDVCMKQNADKNRKELEAKLFTVFNQEIVDLPTELRSILLDDMVTAFENRLNVLNTATEKAIC